MEKALLLNLSFLKFSSFSDVEMDDLDPNRDDNEEVAMEIDETGDFRQGNKNARIQVGIIMLDLDMSKNISGLFLNSGF